MGGKEAWPDGMCSAPLLWNEPALQQCINVHSKSSNAVQSFLSKAKLGMLSICTINAGGCICHPASLLACDQTCPGGWLRLLWLLRSLSNKSNA